MAQRAVPAAPGSAENAIALHLGAAVAEIEGLWAAAVHARRAGHRKRLLDELGRAGSRLAELSAAVGALEAAGAVQAAQGARAAEAPAAEAPAAERPSGGGIATPRLLARHVGRRCSVAARHVDWIIDRFGRAS